MMSGCCTIRSNSNGAYDQIDHGENGFIFTSENSKELAEYIEKIYMDSSLRENLAKKGKLKAIANFTTQKMVNNTLKVYTELIKI